MSCEPAPICLTTYVRNEHLSKTIDALKSNTLARKSELFIFSDAPKDRGDEKLVALNRAYLRTIDGFKNVHIVERESNGRVANGRGAMKQLLDDYGKIIYLEEDIVTAPGFLQYMNDALEFYENNENILSISGYCPPLKVLNNYDDDVFLLQRFCAWGLATWSRKFDPYGFEVRDHGIDEFINDKNRLKNFLGNGADMLLMLSSEYKGEINALDVKLMYYEHKYNKYTLYPAKSLVQNIGHDGTGVHCGTTNKFHHEELWDKQDGFEFKNIIQVEERVRIENYNFRNMDLDVNVIQFIKTLGMHPLIE